MKNFTLYVFLVSIICGLSSPKATAQGDPIILPTVELPTVTQSCAYEDANGCFFASYDAILESAQPGNLTIVLGVATVQGGACGSLQTVTVLPSGGASVVYTGDDFASMNELVLEVDSALFAQAPNVRLTYTSEFETTISFDIPIFGPITFDAIASTRNNVVLEANLDSDEPCVAITPLPVELISFEGAATDNGVELRWSTASEQNNSHFEVERSADGEAFEQVGSVAGHGNSSTRISYTHTDFTPLPGQSYYRLKQVDYDGQYEYSKVIAVTATDELQVTLAPNPCQNGDCQISIQNASGAQETRLELTDLSGRVLYTTTVQHAGNRTITLPLQELPAYKGLYILSAISGGNVVRQRVVLE